ncbi:MAG: GNAT family N-acetyltransferase [Colwellia sp.]|nr:GNAT family N-acetyltransferase [Colwellia sp.]MCW8866327.1 GNAT family N-acetyltransferase [Colwellia sp.]MCW9080651.1 GNAT family N-acetyltransferase [Colwellia sp.]
MDYRITNNKAEMDVDAIHHYLSRSYWAENVPKKVVAKAIENSLCFGVLLTEASGKEQQVGFARLITDSATFAYLADVYILEAHRGQGLSKRMMTKVVEHPQLQGLRRIMLATRDAHGLYEQFGFTPLTDQSMFMQLWTPEVYR